MTHSGVSIPGDTSVARRPSDRVALVEHVHNTASLQETDWLEWKSRYELTTSPGRLSVAKQLIGFANRDPDIAARHAEGHAYLVLGVEPGQYAGMPVHDSADIENWLRPFVGDKLVYDIDYVNAGGVDVLMFIVDPPRSGDDIHSLRKEAAGEKGNAVRAGTVFVRKQGKTEPAAASDIDMLTERARRQEQTLNLRVKATGSVAPLPAAPFEEEYRDRCLARRKAALLANVPDKADPVLGFRRPVGETRSHQEFRRDVERYIAAARRRWSVVALDGILDTNPPTVGFEVVNVTDDYYRDVVVELIVPLAKVGVHCDVDAARETLKVPEEPPGWGGGLAGVFLRDFDIEPAGAVADVEARGEEETFIRFPKLDVRPQSVHQLGELVILATDPGATMPVAWRATSSSTRGQHAGTFELRFAAAGTE